MGVFGKGNEAGANGVGTRRAGRESERLDAAK